MSALTLAMVLQLAGNPACTVPGMPPENVAAVVQQESAGDVTALHDDSTNRSIHPATADDAERIATQLMAQGHSVGVGLLQLTGSSAAGFRAKFGLTVYEALANPCANMRAGAALLAANYRAAVHTALARYNGTGPAADRYAARVEAIAAQMPLIALRALPPAVAVSIPPLPLPSVVANATSSRELVFSPHQ